MTGRDTPGPRLRAPTGVDVEKLESELAARSAARDPTEPAPPTLPAFPGAEADPLSRAAALLGHPGVDYQIGWRTPVLGQAWAALREVIHGEARLYVDSLMARQAEVDAAFLEALVAMQAELIGLRRRLDERGASDGGASDRDVPEPDASESGASRR